MTAALVRISHIRMGVELEHGEVFVMFFHRPESPDADGMLSTDEDREFPVVEDGVHTSFHLGGHGFGRRGFRNRF